MAENPDNTGDQPSTSKPTSSGKSGRIERRNIHNLKVSVMHVLKFWLNILL